ncbi:MAG TPA: DUF1800 domain-containing protein [Pyrinomonadaceae bacterium]|nr:DUF1800 domain-containing protein [Pyrinomonadaceae bacterium]
MSRLKNLSLISRARRTQALCCVVALVLPLFAPLLATAQKQQAQKSASRLAEDQRILHVLNRLGFGVRPGDVERVRAMGLERYIEEQLYPEKIADAGMGARLQRLEALRLSTPELYAKYPQPNQLLRRMQRDGKLPPELAAAVEARLGGNQPNMPAQNGTQNNNGAMAAQNNEAAAMTQEGGRDNEYRRLIRDYYLQNGLRTPQQLVAELQASRILRAVYSERQLQEVMVDFWENHFNVFAAKGADRWLLVSYDRDTIRPNTLGKFKDLLVATAQSPAMLFYLDNFQSTSPNVQQRRRRPLLEGLMQANPQQQQRQRRGINENYARELMELHTLGVEGGYTQKDVQEVARCFTGWTIRAPRGAGGADPDAGTFFFNERMHDDGEKVVLGQKIPAGGGMRDGLMVLEILARHPSTAKFIATKLARRFVMDNPTPELVSRISAAYTKSDGSIRETLRAVIASPEFNSQAAYRAKIKTPFELAISAIRTLGGETNGGPAIHQWIARMGEPLYMYQAPTGYPDTAEDWVNTGSLLERMNFALALASNRIPGTRVDLSRFAGEAAAAQVDKTKVMERFIGVILNGEVSTQTKTTLTSKLNEPLPAPSSQPAQPADTEDARGQMARGGARGQRQMARADTGRVVGNVEVVKIAGLILGSPEFQRQ